MIFFGTPQYSADVLTSIVEAGHQVELVVTQPDKKRGRGGALSPSPVKACAMKLGIPVSHRPADALKVEADLGVLVAFGRLIKPELLRHVTILNIHPSLLPRWRGATPVEAALLAGDKTTGVCVMQLSEELDAGPVYASKSVEIGDETSIELYNKLYEIGTELLLDQLKVGPSEPREQIGESTYCGKLSAEDLHIDWKKPAEHIERLTRIGKAWTTFNGARFIVHQAKVHQSGGSGSAGHIDGNLVATGEGSLELIRVQPAGKPPLEAKAWLNGLRNAPSNFD